MSLRNRVFEVGRNEGKDRNRAVCSLKGGTSRDALLSLFPAAVPLDQLIFSGVLPNSLVPGWPLSTFLKA